MRPIKKIQRKLRQLKVGSEIYHKQTNELFIVRGKQGKFLVATTEPGGETYTIIDIEQCFCGPNDRIFNPYDYRKQEDIEECLRDFNHPPEDMSDLKISQRYGMNVEDVIDLPGIN
ncbi:hypothetical protein [Shouchella clausii]|uniref:hypothetical protein n=1 Tax=Shouchella clausii TaxID=79880 RepID=UPI001C73BBF3|nr:hypothetical protein [Shouchella clausii]MBX0320119.1 hypothetical protein [Shouchella clausii]